MIAALVMEVRTDLALVIEVRTDLARTDLDLASATVIAALVIEVRTDLAFPLALVLAFSLAFVLAFPLALVLISLGVFLGLVDDVLLVAVRAALAIRTRLSVADVEARKQLLLFGGRGKSSSNRTVFVKLVQLFALLLQPSLFDQEVALLPKSLTSSWGHPREDDSSS